MRSPILLTRGARLPVAVLIATALLTGSLVVSTAVPRAHAQDSTGTTDPTEPTTTTAPPEPPDSVLPPHSVTPTDRPLDPVDPDAPRPEEPADPSVPAPLLRDPTPHIRVLLADLAVLDGRAHVPAAQAAVDAATAELADRQAELDQARAQHQTDLDGLAARRRVFDEFAVVSFMRASGGALPQLAEAGVFEQRQRAQLSGAVLEHQTKLIAAAASQVGASDGIVLERQAAVQAAEQAVADQQVGLDAALDVVRRAEAERLAAGREDHHRLFDPELDGGRAAKRVAVTQSWQLTLAGQSTFTAEELAAWFHQWKVAPQAGVGAAELARYYVEEGNTENIRGDVMLAQSIWETGTFSNDDTRRLNNFAGIGHCDTCPEGFGFSSARDGVRAQVQLLKSYVEVAPTYEHPLVDRRLRGPAGCCQTWNQLTGVWATAPTYGPLILGLYEEMLQWLVLHRSAGGVEPVGVA